MSGPRRTIRLDDDPQDARNPFRGRWSTTGAAAGDVPDEPDWGSWGWTGGGRRFPLLGVVLVLLGAGLLIRQLDPRIGWSTLVFLALALAFSGAWLLGRSRFAVVPAFFFFALGVPALLQDLGVVVGEGWTTLSLGVALLVAWGFGRLRGRTHGWALWLGGLLTIVGLAQVSYRLAGLPAIGALWPVIIIVAGLLIIFRDRLPTRTHAR